MEILVEDGLVLAVCCVSGKTGMERMMGVRLLYLPNMTLGERAINQTLRVLRMARHVPTTSSSEMLPYDLPVSPSRI